MAKLMLPAPLYNLLPAHDRSSGAGRTVALDAASWTEAVHELRERFPELAKRVLTDGGSIAAGFAVVVNDEVKLRSESGSLTFTPNDEICLITALAGG